MADLDKTERVPKDKELAERMGALVREIRSRRRQTEEAWLNNHAAWKGYRLEHRQAYKSAEYQYYIPAARRAIERIVTRATQMLMPSPSWFEIYPGDEYDLSAGMRADSVRSYIQHVATTKVNTRRFITQLARSLLLYNRAIAKNTVMVTDGRVDWAGYREQVRQVWPHSRAVDPFAFYVWPETITDMADAVLTHEDVMMPWQEYEQAVREGRAESIRRDELTTPEWPHYVTRRLAQVGIADPSSVRQSQAEPEREKDEPKVQSFVALTELYFKSGGRWVRAWLVWNVEDGPRIVRIRRSAYPIPPYRVALARPLPGDHYTTGSMDDIETLQVLFNDQVNQGEAARTLAAEPPIAVDEILYPRRDELVWGPRRFWHGGGPDGVQPMQFPDTSLSSHRMAQLTLALINSIAGGGGLAEAQPTRGLPRAGGAVQSLIGLALADVKDVAEIIEQEVLTPTLGDWYRLTVAFAPHEQIVRIPGAQNFPPRTMRVDDLLGNWEFKWIGSQQVQDKQARSQQFIAGITLLTKAEPLLMRAGWKVNWPHIFKMAWRDGFGERGVEQIIVPASPQEQAMAAAAGAAGAGAGAEAGGSPIERLVAGLSGVGDEVGGES